MAHVAEIKSSLGLGTTFSSIESEALQHMVQILGADNFREEIIPILSAARNRVVAHRKSQSEMALIEKQYELAIAERDDQTRREREIKAANAKVMKAKQEMLSDMRKKCSALLHTNFIAADCSFRNNPDWVGLEEHYSDLKSEFVQKWFNDDARTTGRKLPNLDKEQIEAISSVDGNVQVVARAGSGKTLVSVLRAYFLIKHCGVRPSEILLLAFNRDAALEIRRRLLFMFKPDAEELYEISRRGKLADRGPRTVFDIDSEVVRELTESLGVELPFAMTFHALAYAIVRPEGRILVDDPNTDDESLGGTVQRIVNDVLRDEAKSQSIRDLMMRHFKNDWEYINSEEFSMSRQELLLWRRSLPNQTIDGLYRKSPGEKLISDFFFEHGIEYHYERNVWWGNQIYRPDFTILKPGNRNSGLVIEFFGLNDPTYLEQIEEKRRFWQQKDGWTLVEVYPQDVAKGKANIEALLLPHILCLGISAKKLTDEEIWTLIEDDAILQYTRLLTGFIARCRQVGWDSGQLRIEIERHSPDVRSVEWLFLRQVDYLYALYESTLKALDQTDFPKLIADAVKKIQAGDSEFYRTSGNGNLAALRYISVDEFQDFSFLFDSLLKAIAKVNEEVSLFCVGDDWQAINGFAGSDLLYFENFLRSVPDSKRLYLSTNYRSDASVVNFGNVIMAGHGREAIPSKPKQDLPLIGYLDEIVLTATELERSENDLITPALLRIVESQLKLDRDVVVLSRTNSIPYYTDSSESGFKAKNLDSFLQHLQSYFPEEVAKRISISSAHRYKGRERQTVIIFDAREKRYPLMHRDWVFYRIFGLDLNVLAEDERRLFYVAATRAKEQLFVLAESREDLTPYIDGEGQGHAELDWNHYPPPASKINPVIVRVQDVHQGSTYSMRELLTANSFRWFPVAKTWQKAFLPDAFSFESLKNQSWARPQLDLPKSRILVTFNSQPHGDIAQFEVRNGEWRTIFSNFKILESDLTSEDS